MDISVYIPVFNNVAWCRSVPLLPGVRYIASDNASTDGSAEALEKRGVTVIKQERNLGRIGNWSFCVEHFRRSGCEWMKWLFAGDILAPDFVRISNNAASQFPSARMIIGDNIHIDGTKRFYYKVLEKTCLYSPKDALALLAQIGNWFYSPINQMYHSEAILNGFDYGSFEWAADTYFCLNVATKYPVLYWNESFGEFHVAARRFFSAQGTSFLALIETALIRQIAAGRFLNISKDQAEYERLCAIIERDIRRRLLSRRVGTLPAGKLIQWLKRVIVKQ